MKEEFINVSFEIFQRDPEQWIQKNMGRHLLLPKKTLQELTGDRPKFCNFLDKPDKYLQGSVNIQII